MDNLFSKDTMPFLTKDTQESEDLLDCPDIFSEKDNESGDDIFEGIDDKSILDELGI